MAVHILFRPAAAAALVNAQTTLPQPPSPTMVRRSARLLQQPHIHHQGIMLNPVASSSSHTPPIAVITPKKTQHPVSRKRARPAEVNTSHTESESENEVDSSHGKSSQRLRRPTATAASAQAPIIQNSQALKTTARSLRAQKRQKLSGSSDGGDEPLLGKSSLPSTPKAAAVPGLGHTTPTSTHTSSPKLQTMAMSIPPPNATKTRAAKRKSLSGEPGTGAILVQHENKAKATLDNDLCPPSLKKKRKTPETPSQDLHTMHVVKKSNGKGKEKAKEEGEEAITTSNELAAPRVGSLRPRRQQHTSTTLSGASKTKTTNKNTADKRKSGRPRPSASDNTPASPAGDIQSRGEASTSNVPSTSNETNPPPKPNTSTSNNTSSSSSSSNTTNSNNNNTRNTPANPSILPISTTPASSSNATSTSNPPPPLSPILSSPPSSPPTSPRSASALPSHHAALTQPHAITQPHIHSPLTPLAHTTTTPPGSPPLGGGLGMCIGLGQRVSPPLDAVDLGPLLVSSSSTSTSNSGSASGSGSSSVKEKERTSAHSSPRASPPPPPSPIMPLTPSSLLTNAIGNSRSINNFTTSNSNNNTSPIALPIIPSSVFPPSFNEANVDASSHVSEDSIPSPLTSTTTTERSCSSSPILAPTTTTITDGTILHSPPPPQAMDMPMGSMLGLELGLGLPLPLPLLPSISMSAGSSSASYPGSSPGSVSASASGPQESQLLNSGGEEHAPAPIAMPMLMHMHGLMGMNVGVGGMGMGMGGGMQPSESEIGFGFQAGEYGGVFGASGNGSGDGTAGNGNGVVGQGMLHHSVDPMYGSGPSSGSSIGDGMEHQQHQQLHQEEGVMLMSRDDQLAHAQEQAQVHYELVQQQQQQAQQQAQQQQQQQQQQRVGSPQPSLRLTLKQQKKLTYMPPTRLEDPPYIQKDTSLWATACKLRVWEMSKRYTPEIMRTVTAQYAHDYYTTTGTFPLGYKKSASLRHPHHLGHHRRRSSGSAKGKERQTGDADAADPTPKRRRKGGAGGEEGAPEEDEDFMSEKCYPFELMDEDEDDEGAGREDGGAEGWGAEGAEMEDEGVYDDWDEEDEDDWDEDEDEDETDEDEEVEVAVSAAAAAEAAMAASAASVPGSPAGSSTPTTPGTTPPIVTIVTEDGTVLSGDEDAEGEMEVDIEAFSDPSFNAELSSPTSPTTPAAPLSPDEGKVSVFYVPPPGAFQMQYGEAQAWDEVPHEGPQQQQMQQPMLVDQHQQQQESLDQEQHQHMQQHEQDQYQQHQHQQHQPPIQIQLTPANQSYMLSPVLSLPPPRLDSIRVGYLRHTELGAKLTGRGTPADRTRAAMWAKGWKVWVEEMEERRREEEAEQIMGMDSEKREGSRSPKRGAEDMEGVGGEGEERGRARLRLEGLGDGLGDADLVVEVGRLSLPPSSSAAECGMLGDEHTHHESCEVSRTEMQWDTYLCLEGKGPGSSSAGGHEAKVKLPSSASSLEMELEHHLPRHHDIVSASDQNGRPPQPSVYTTPRPGQLSSTSSSVSGSQSESSLSLEGSPSGVDEGMFGLSMFDMGMLEPNTWFASGGAADGGVGMGVGVDGVGVGGGDAQSVTASGTSTLSFALG